MAAARLLPARAYAMIAVCNMEDVATHTVHRHDAAAVSLPAHTVPDGCGHNAEIIY